MNPSNMNRRNLIHGGIAAIATAAAAKTAEAACTAVTPAQTSGPFYPVTHRDDVNSDLTQVEGQAGTALGEPIWVTGKVQTLSCAPIPGALVEIWQASDSGKYDHPEDDNPAPLDPNFQYWGRVTTDNTGTYRFKTVLPGLYPGRTRHIHYRVVAPGHRTLITQLYFTGETMNERDAVYRNLTPAQRALVTSSLTDGGTPGQIREAVFNIVLGRSGGATPEIDS